MIKLACMLLKNRKSFLVSIVGLITVSIVLTNFAIITSNSIYEQKKDRAQQTYGAFISGVNDLSEEEISSIKDNKKIIAGFFELYGNSTFNDTILTIGFGDTAFINMVNADLQAGKMPSADHEIAIEEFVADLYGISVPGVEIDLVINEKSEKLLVTGIICNYSSQLDIDYQLKKGINNYPNILCSKYNMFNENNFEKNKSVLLDFKDDINFSKSYDTSRIKMYQEMESMGIREERAYTNDSFFNRGLEYCPEIKTLCSYFIGTIILSTILCCIMLLRIFYKNYIEKFGVFITCGLQKNKAMYIVVIQIIIMLLISGGISICASSIISKRFIPFLFTGISENMMHFNYLAMGVWYILFCFLLILSCLYCFLGAKNASIYQGLVKNHIRRKTCKQHKNGYNIKKGISHPKLSIVCIFSGLFCICFLSLYSFALLNDSYDWMPDYELYSKYTESFEILDGYEIEKGSESYLSHSSVNKLENFKPNISIDCYPYVNSNTLLLEKGKIPEYFKKWLNTYKLEDTEVEKSIIEKNWPPEADEKIPIPNVEFVFADETMLKQILTTYDLDTNVKDLIETSKILIFLPEADSKTDIGIKKGDEITLGGICLYDQDVIFETIKMEADSIIPKKYSILNDGYIQERDCITIIVSKKYAEKSPFFKGYQSLKIDFTSNLSSELITKIDNCVHQIKSEVQGGILYSKQYTIENERAFKVYSNFLATSITIIVIIFCSVFVYTQLYYSIVEKEKEYAVLRSMGASIGWLSENIRVSYFRSMLISFGINAFVVLLFIGSEIPAYQYLICIIISLLIVFLVFLISIFLPKKIIKKAPIADALKEGN